MLWLFFKICKSLFSVFQDTSSHFVRQLFLLKRQSVDILLSTGRLLCTVVHILYYILYSVFPLSVNVY
jgi:hypothetical protein